MMTRGPKSEAGGRRVGLALDSGAELQHRLADPEVVAELEAEPVEDRGVDRRAEMRRRAGASAAARSCAGASATAP